MLPTSPFTLIILTFKPYVVQLLREESLVYFIAGYIYAQKAKARVEIKIQAFLTSAKIGGEWLAACPCRLIPPGKESPVPTE
jgi:hypothetical protein